MSSTTPDLIPASVQCLLNHRKGRYIAASAGGCSADKTVAFFHRDGATYKVYADIIDACRCEAGEPEPAPKPPGRTQPMPRDKWPWWAKLIAKRARSGEAGVGDTFERLVRGERVKRWAEKRGIRCSCENRKRAWSELFKY